MRLLLVALLLPGCKEDAPAGTLGGPCLPGDACAAGLLCVGGACEERGAAMPVDAAPPLDAPAAAADGTVDGGTAVGQPPTATITHPGSETRPAGSSVPFTGIADDSEDGGLTGDSLVWVSSLAGEIGRGESFSATLSAGTHTVTLTATDSDGNQGSDQVTFAME